MKFTKEEREEKANEIMLDIDLNGSFANQVEDSLSDYYKGYLEEYDLSIEAIDYGENYSDESSMIAVKVKVD